MVYRSKKILTMASEVIAETLWPTRCAICDTPGHLICNECRSKLIFIDSCSACPKCGAPYGLIQCTECNRTILSLIGREEIPYDQMVHALILDDRAKRIVATYKDKGDRKLAQEMATYMTQYIKPEWISQECAITFIPATKAAFRKRGFDHVEEMTAMVSKLSGLRYISLFSRPASNDQRKLTRKQRFSNISNRISLSGKQSVPKNVIVIDDVCTTGSTLYSAADALREAGVKRLYALTLGRVI